MSFARTPFCGHSALFTRITFKKLSMLAVCTTFLAHFYLLTFCVCVYVLKAHRWLEFCVCVWGKVFAAFIVACVCVCGKVFIGPHFRRRISMWKSSLLPSYVHQSVYGMALWCLNICLCVHVEKFFAVFFSVCVCACVCVWVKKLLAAFMFACAI